MLPRQGNRSQPEYSPSIDSEPGPPPIPAEHGLKIAGWAIVAVAGLILAADVPEWAAIVSRVHLPGVSGLFAMGVLLVQAPVSENSLWRRRVGAWTMVMFASTVQMGANLIPLLTSGSHLR
jgi:hypothetical protein